MSIILRICHCACATRPYFHFWSKIWRHHRVPRPRFPTKRVNFGDSRTFKADIYFYLIFAWVFRTSLPKMGFMWDKIGEGVVRYWPPTNSFLLFGVLTTVPILVKIDEEMRPWECSQTDRQTDTQTDANRFLPRCMKCRRGLAMRILSVCPSVCLSVRLSHACIVTKRKKDRSRFSYHTKEHLA